MKLIPLNTVPSQLISIVLAEQNCQISVYTKSTGTYLDLTVNDKPIITTRLAVDRVAMIQGGYQGFIGNLVFVDAQGNDNPDWTQYGSRFYLVYVEASDL